MSVRRWATILAFLISASGGALAQEAPDRSIEQAQEKVSSGAYSEAIAVLDAIPAGAAAPPEVRRRIDTIRAESLLGQGYFDAAVAPARAALEASRGLAAGEVADTLLLVARVEISRTNSPLAAEALEQALAAATEADGPDGLRALRVRDRIALVMSATKAADAEKLMRDVIAQADRLPAGAARDRLRFLNTLGITLQRQSKFDPAREAFSSARDGRLRLLSERHPETLESTHNWGVALRRLNRAKDADAAFAEALRWRVAVLGADHPETLITRTMIVRQLIDKSEFDAAVTEAQAVCAALVSRVGEKNVRTLEANGDLANALFSAGRVSEGVETYGRTYALAAATLGETNPEAMNIGHEYAGLLYRSGRYGEALSIFQRVLSATRKQFDDENRDTVATLHSIGVVLSDLGRNEDAIAAYRYVISVLNKQVPESHSSRLSALNNLSQALSATGQFDEALSTIDEVVRLRTSTPGPEASLTLLSRSNQAAVLAAKRRYPEAIAAHREVYSIRARKFGDGHPETLKSLHNLASTLREAGAFSEARPLFERVVQARIDAAGPRNINTVTSMRGLAGLLVETGQTDEARRWYLRIVEAAELLRSQGGLPDTLRRSFFSTVTPAYKALAILEAESGNFDGALKVAELSKARTLLETSSGRGLARSILPADERGALSDLEFRIANLDGRIPLVQAVADRTDLEAQRNGLSERFSRLNADLQSKYPLYREATDLRLSNGTEAASLLPEDGAILSFVQDGARMLVLWMTRTGERGSFLLPNHPNVATTIEAYRAALAKPDGIEGLRYPLPGVPRRLVWKLQDGSFRMQEAGDGAVEGASIVRDIDEIRDSLSSWILGAMPAQVLAKRRWFVSPDGPMALVPLETLKSGGKLIAETHDISLIQSISMMSLARDRLRRYSAETRQPMLVVGDPSYAPTAPVPAAAPLRGIDALRGPGGSPLARPRWPALPGSAKEVAALGSLFDLRAGTNLFSGPAASETTLRRLQDTGDLGRYRYVVFSTHGYLDRQNPELSGIVLSQLDVNDGEDGYLRTPEIASLDFRSDLVFISACETGVGKWVSGEGLLGLPFALYAGGNGATILTLWPILDGSTAEFVERFFKKVKAGASPVAALSETKREFIRGDAGTERKSPAVWAPFVYYGD
jgi:CHAT domain-containing protein/tetratricopeptide (TPR) repeat protein